MFGSINIEKLFYKLKEKLRKNNKNTFLKYRLSKPYTWGYFDSVDVERCGILRINGWSRDHNLAFTGLRVYINAQELELLNSYRIYRPDVSAAIASDHPFLGFTLEYLFYPRAGQEVTSIEIVFENEKIFELDERIEIRIPHYEHLFSESKVLHRNNIYGYGPPAREVGIEVLALAKTLPQPIIDFGCGSGALVKELRSLGYSAFGVELDRPEINESLFKEVRPYITIYNGRFPLPFDDGSFESGICTEVLEHVEAYDAAIIELARLIRRRLIVTVPDMSSIPLLHQHNVVPWHLLEATHVNFFTQKTLSNFLKNHFSKIEFARIGSSTINGTQFYVSLVAICDK